MTTIKTHLRTASTDHQGNIETHGNGQAKAFSGVYNLGLILGSQDDETKRFPVDDDELPHLSSALNNVIDECLCGLASIGRLIMSGDTRHTLNESEAYGVGSVIQHLALLAQESQTHLENIALDQHNRNTAKGDRSWTNQANTVLSLNRQP